MFESCCWKYCCRCLIADDMFMWPTYPVLFAECDIYEGWYWGGGLASDIICLLRC